MRNKQPWLKVIPYVVGFEGEEGGQAATASSGGNGGEIQPGTQPGDGAESGEGDDEGGEGGGGTPKTYTAAEVAGLRSALEKERSEKKALDKEVKSHRKAKQESDDQEKTEVQRLTEAQQKSSDKLTKLATRFRQSSIESAILTAARDAKFTDPTDALRAEVIDTIGVEQDEDDPTQVEIDSASVTAAVKKLAKAKPHYLAATKKDLPPSGPKFGGSGGANPQQQSAEQQRLASLYPALARQN